MKTIYRIFVEPRDGETLDDICKDIVSLFAVPGIERVFVTHCGKAYFVEPQTPYRYVEIDPDNGRKLMR